MNEQELEDIEKQWVLWAKSGKKIDDTVRPLLSESIPALVVEVRRLWKRDKK